jgi:hypothetical protein
MLGGLSEHKGEHIGIGYIAANTPSAQMDLFGRINTATPTTLFTTQVAFTLQQENVQYLSTGTASFFYDMSNSVVQHRVGTTAGRAVRQSREYLLYQPGKLQSCVITGTPELSGNFDNSIAVRMGLFDDYRDKSAEPTQPSMGHFFELSGNTWYVVERANSYDNVTNVTRIPQSNWNLDTVNGNRSTSPSGYILKVPPNTGVLFTIDRQWLGVGIVRMGIIFNGKPIFVHAFHDRLYGRPYTHLPKLPVRWEIEKVAGGASLPATMGSICASVTVFGQYQPFGVLYALPTSLAPAQSIDATMRPLLVIRLQQKYCRATFKLLSLDIYAPNGDVAYTVFKNPGILGSPALTYTAFPDTRSMIEYCYTGTPTNYTLTDGIPIRSGFASKNTSVVDQFSTEELITAHSFCSDIEGNPDILVISGFEYSNTSVYITCRWMEIV